MEGATTVPQRKRRRPPLACERCRQQKIKCDRNMGGCNQCAQAKKSPCTYVQDDRAARKHPAPSYNRIDSSATPPPSAGGSSTSASRAGDPFDTWNQLPASSFSRNSASTSSTMGSHRGGATHPPEDQGGLLVLSNLKVITDRLQILEEKLSSTVQAIPTESQLDERMSSLTGTFSKARFFGQSNWRNSIDQFEDVLGLYYRSESDKNSEIMSLLDKCKGLARSIKTSPQDYLSIPPEFRTLVPSKSVADQLVHEYLRTFEYIYRILHVPSFQEEYTRYWENPQSASASFIMRLLLVMSIGSCFYQDPIDNNFTRLSAVQWIHTAQSWLGSPSQKSRINLSGLQIHCLLLLARQINGVGADLVWISAGSLLCTAMHMGLHRDPSNFPKMSFFHSELRRRLWVTIMEIIVQSSMDAGGVPTISSSDFDCRLPSNLDDVSLTEAGKTPASAKSMDTFTQSSVQIALARSFPIRLKIAKLINSCGPGLSYEETIRLGADLSSVCRANCLLFQSFRTTQGQPTAFHIKVLDLLAHRFLLGLHHAFVIRSYANPTYYFSRKVSLDCSLQLLSSSPATQSAHILPEDDDADYIRLVTLASGLFRNVPLQAAINIALELIKQLKEDASSITSASSSRSRRELKKAIEDYVKLLGNRIIAGETNVKGFVLFSCVLAQINAMQTGISVDQSIFTASTESLKVCYEILRTKKEAEQNMALQNDWAGNMQVEEECPNDGYEWEDMMQDQRLSDNNLWDPWLSSSSMQVENSFFT